MAVADDGAPASPSESVSSSDDLILPATLRRTPPPRAPPRPRRPPPLPHRSGPPHRCRETQRCYAGPRRVWVVVGWWPLGVGGTFPAGDPRVWPCRLCLPFPSGLWLASPSFAFSSGRGSASPICARGYRYSGANSRLAPLSLFPLLPSCLYPPFPLLPQSPDRAYAG